MSTLYTTDFWVTFAVLLAAGAVIGLMAWIEKKPKTELQPRLLPTTLFTVVAVLVALMAFFHLTDLLKPH